MEGRANGSTHSRTLASRSNIEHDFDIPMWMPLNHNPVGVAKENEDL
jgi:hypothetical protein